MPAPTQDDYYDLILSCRYGDMEDVDSFISQFGVEHLATAKDENGNTILHMAAANGHTDLIKAILSQIPRPSLPALLRAQNNSGSTALHWAALNTHLETCQCIVEFDVGEGTGVELIEMKNGLSENGEREGGHGRSVLGVAEEMEWEEGARWMVSVMRLDEVSEEQSGQSNDVHDAEGQDSDEKFEGGDVEVEIEDADGGIARMSLGSHSFKPVEVVTPTSSIPQGSSSTAAIS